MCSGHIGLHDIAGCTFVRGFPSLFRTQSASMLLPLLLLLLPSPGVQASNSLTISRSDRNDGRKIRACVFGPN